VRVVIRWVSSRSLYMGFGIFFRFFFVSIPCLFSPFNKPSNVNFF